MSLATLIARLSVSLTPEERAAFRAEQRNTVQLKGLPLVHRIFVGV